MMGPMQGRWAMATGLAMALVHGACDDSVWIEIRVPDGVSADEVELFIADARCKHDDVGCRGLRPAPGPDTNVALIPGTVYEHNRDLTFVARVSGGSASFRIAASDATIPALIAIGIEDGTGLAAGGVVLSSIDLSLGARHVIATLEPEGNGTRVYRWPGPAEADRELGCAGVRHGTEPATFAVSPDDWDCDGFANEAPVECEPLVYRANYGAQAIDCAEESPVGPGMACLLGKSSCTDGVGGACRPSQNPIACVPQQLCDQCSGRSEDCLIEAFDKAPTFVACTFPVVREGDHFTVCGIDNRAVTSALIDPGTPALACPVAPLLGTQLLDPAAPTSLVTFSTDGQLAALKVTPLESVPCLINVELGGDLGLSYAGRRFPLHVQANALRTLQLPLDITLAEITQQECDAGAVPLACTSKLVDSVFECVNL